MLFYGYGSPIDKTWIDLGAHTLLLLASQADLLLGKLKSLVSRPFQLGRPTGSTRVASGPLNLFQFYQFEIHDRKKACSRCFKLLWVLNKSNFSNLGNQSWLFYTLNELWCFRACFFSVMDLKLIKLESIKEPTRYSCWACWSAKLKRPRD